MYRSASAVVQVQALTAPILPENMISHTASATCFRSPRASEALAQPDGAYDRAEPEGAANRDTCGGQSALRPGLERPRAQAVRGGGPGAARVGCEAHWVRG